MVLCVKCGVPDMVLALMSGLMHGPTGAFAPESVSCRDAAQCFDHVRKRACTILKGLRVRHEPGKTAAVTMLWTSAEE